MSSSCRGLRRQSEPSGLDPGRRSESYSAGTETTTLLLTVFIDVVPLTCARWNFSVGNFELKLLSEMQSGINFLEGEVASGDFWKEKQRVIADDDSKQAKNQQNQNQNLDLVIKVSVPDWKVMAFSSESDGQLLWERQVRNLTCRSHSDECSSVMEMILGSSCTVSAVVLHTHRLSLAGGGR